MNRFIAIDVETANSNYGSICQAGLAIFEDGKITGTWESYIDPEEDFDGINISIHGIDERKVIGAPKASDIIPALNRKFPNEIFVHHTPYDRLSFDQAALKYQVPPLNVRWLDSARVVRRVWPEYRKSGWGLANLADKLNIQFAHHDALEDAQAAGKILWQAVLASDCPLDEWLDRAYQKIRINTNELEANPEGLFFGETIVFTGAISIPRAQASTLASKAGCDVDDKVNSRTTMLVVGAQDLRKLAGNEKSSKHRKAEDLIKSGQKIRILSEADFMKMVESY